eukprot:7036787-Alexandrium_andersonii.AAC.1
MPSKRATDPQQPAWANACAWVQAHRHVWQTRGACQQKPADANARNNLIDGVVRSSTANRRAR